MEQASEMVDPKTVVAMLEACKSGNRQVVEALISENPVYAYQQENEFGKSPLMAAAGAGYVDICQLLLEYGAPWNAVDRYAQCAGNYATDNQNWEVVNLLVDAGTKAELILGASIRLQKAMSMHTDEHDHDTSSCESLSCPVEHEPCTKPDYLRQRLSYNSDGTALLDQDDDAVMMEWERPLMEAHASILMETPGKRVLNVGFGMGIIDTALQTHNPTLHIIVEAHPDVYKHMLDKKWDKKPNVRICYGKWQDVLPKLIKEGVVVDGIFYDTYGEHFMDLEDFHRTMVEILSKPHGVYSFFNGLAPDNLFFHGVGKLTGMPESAICLFVTALARVCLLTCPLCAD